MTRSNPFLLATALGLVLTTAGHAQDSKPADQATETTTEGAKPDFEVIGLHLRMDADAAREELRSRGFQKMRETEGDAELPNGAQYNYLEEAWEQDRSQTDRPMSVNIQYTPPASEDAVISKLYLDRDFNEMKPTVAMIEGWRTETFVAEPTCMIGGRWTLLLDSNQEPLEDAGICDGDMSAWDGLDQSSEPSDLPFTTVVNFTFNEEGGKIESMGVYMDAVDTQFIDGAEHGGDVFFSDM